MIKIGRISDVSTDFDENWLVVRSLKAVPPHAIHEPRLSPSRRLFHSYLDAKAEGKVGAEWFQRVYVRAFLRELASDRANMLLVDQLYRDSFTKISCWPASARMRPCATAAYWLGCLQAWEQTLMLFFRLKEH